MRKSLLIGVLALSTAYTAQAVAEMPAVTGFNGKVEGGYGQLDGENLYGVGASLAFPVVEQMGVQVDLNLGMQGEEDNAAYGGGLSYFWRSSSVGSFGISGAYVDVEDAAWIARYQADGEIYLNNITLGADLGFQDSDWGDDGAFFGGASLTLYPVSNIALNGGVDVFAFDGDNDVQFSLGGEVGLADVFSIFADAKIGTESEESFFIGARFAFGSNTSDLMKQHREYNTRGNVINEMLRENETLLNNAAAVNAAQAAGRTCPLPASPLDPVLCLLF